MYIEKLNVIDDQALLADENLTEKLLGFLRENGREFNALIAYYECAIMEMETKFKVLNRQFSLQYDRNPIEGVQTRIKSTDSLIRKLIRRGIPLDMDSIEREIHDIAGVRVVCSFVDDIYMLADCLIQQDDVTLVEAKDYIKEPKENGYRSLHLIVRVPIFLDNDKKEMKVEVQLRTIAMDCWASLEHKLQYKRSLPAEQSQYIASELRECADICAAVDQRMEDIRNAIASANVDKLDQTRQLHSDYIVNRISGLGQEG